MSTLYFELAKRYRGRTAPHGSRRLRYEQTIADTLDGTSGDLEGGDRGEVRAQSRNEAGRNLRHQSRQYRLAPLPQRTKPLDCASI